MLHAARNARISLFYNKTLVIDGGDSFRRFTDFPINFAQTRIRICKNVCILPKKSEPITICIGKSKDEWGSIISKITE